MLTRSSKFNSKELSSSVQNKEERKHGARLIARTGKIQGEAKPLSKDE